ncbi:MAG: response regulator [Deltaproteobacteria bacterium]|nr:response regulator [Deltaproteobacteria bacterium]
MKKNLLLIEDNEYNLYMMSFLLEKNGFDVKVAKNGKDGIMLALSEKPEVILLDIQLPEMDGYQVLKELKNHDELKNIPVIAVTSYAMPGDREKILQAGANGYIEKPINPDTFISDILKCLKDGS